MIEVIIMINKNRKIKASKTSEPMTLFTGALFVILVIYSLALLGLFGWSLMTAFKSASEFRVNKFDLPQDWTFENFTKAFTTMGVDVILDGRPVKILPLMQLIYSIIYAGGGALLLTIVPCVVAYVTAKYPCKFSTFINTFVIVVMVIPIVGSQASELALIKELHMYDTLWGAMIQKFSFLGTYYLVFYASFKSVSKTYTEAAQIDGAGEFTVMSKIVMPLMFNIIGAVYIIKFIELWNDYQTPMLYLPSYPTLAYGVYYTSVLKNSAAIGPTVRIAASVMVALPVVVLFALFKEKLMGKLSMGGIKE